FLGTQDVGHPGGGREAYRPRQRLGARRRVGRFSGVDQWPVLGVDRGQAVAVLTQGERALAQATTVEAVKDIRDRAGAVKRWLRDRRHRIEDVNAVMRLKLMAERKLGALLA